MIDVSTLQPRRHEPPRGWDQRTFDAVVDALAAALVSSYRRDHGGAERVEASA